MKNRKNIAKILIAAAIVAVSAFGAGALYKLSEQYKGYLGGTRTDIYVHPTNSTASPGESCANPDFNSINAAVAAAQTGNTVHICPGTYTENVSVSVPNITIQGANAGLAGYDAARTAESEIDGYVLVNADNVVIDGIKIKNGNPIWGELSGIMASAANNLTIKNSLLERPNGGFYNSPKTFDGSRGFINTWGGLNNLQILDNKFIGWHKAFWLMNASNVLIDGNLFTENISGASIDGAFGVDITNNEFIDNAYGCIAWGYKATALNINNNVFDGNSFYDTSSTSILSNWISSSSPDYIVANAENNYWGRATGPHFSELYTIADIDVCPFLDAEGGNSVNDGICATPKDIYVNDDSTLGSGSCSSPDVRTIQGAIDVANAGDTIHVCDGTYTESSMINVDKNDITIVGEGATADDVIVTSTVAYTGRGNDGVFNIKADGLTVKSLKVLPVDISAFLVNNASISDLTIDSVNVVGSDTPEVWQEKEAGIWVDDDAAVAGLTVKNSNFELLDYGFYFMKNVAEVTDLIVSDVTVDNTSFIDNQVKGIYVEKLDNATFSNCTVTGNGHFLTFWNAKWNAGFDINLKAADYSDITIDNCAFSNNAKNIENGAALTIKARDDGSTYGPNPATLSGVNVTNTTITGNERGILFGEAGKDNVTPININIENSDVYNNVATYATPGITVGDVVDNRDASILDIIDADYNYWGYVDGPNNAAGGAASAVVDATNINFCPFWSDLAHSNPPYWTGTCLASCPDLDGDGHLDKTAYGCDGDDCNDSSAAAYPGATETCDQIDNDCNGFIDENAVCGSGGETFDDDDDDEMHEAADEDEEDEDEDEDEEDEDEDEDEEDDKDEQGEDEDDKDKDEDKDKDKDKDKDEDKEQMHEAADEQDDQDDSDEEDEEYIFGKDSNDTDWIEYAKILEQAGIVDSAEEYNPYAALNRAELLKFAILLADIEINTEDAPEFEDVSEDDWFYGYVSTGAKLGIVEGYRNSETGELTGYYGPSDPVTRAQAMKIFVNTLVSEGVLENLHSAPSDILADVKNYAWYYGHVASAYNEKIDQGYNLMKMLRTSKPGNEGDAVAVLQLALQTAGYYDGEINGEYNSATRSAIIAFQIDQDIVKTDVSYGAGWFGPKTYYALIDELEGSGKIFRPEVPISRAETAVSAVRVLNLLAE